MNSIQKTIAYDWLTSAAAHASATNQIGLDGTLLFQLDAASGAQRFFRLVAP